MKIRSLQLSACNLALLAAACMAPCTSAATLYNAVTEFATSSNPNGVWAYGTNSGAGGAFEAFTNSSSSSPLAYWSRDNSALYYPNVQKNVTGSTFDNGFGLSVPTDVLYMSPGLELGGGANNAESRFSIVRFTAALAGEHTFTGEFLGLQQPFTRGGGFPSAPGPTTLVSALLNGTTSVMSPTSLNAPSGSVGGNVAINFALTLAIGETVLFIVDPTTEFALSNASLDFQGDSVGLRLIVSAEESTNENSTIPEPSTAILLGAGLAAAAFLRKK